MMPFEIKSAHLYSVLSPIKSVIIIIFISFVTYRQRSSVAKFNCSKALDREKLST